MTEPTPPIEHAPPTAQPQTQTQQNVALPRITIKYCTQCKWLLRAAYVRPFHHINPPESCYTILYARPETKLTDWMHG
jgi:hypothetical protein